MSANEDKGRSGDIRLSAAEQELALEILGGPVPEGFEELARRQMKHELARRSRRPESRAKLMSRAALGATTELTPDQQAWVDRARAVIRRAGHRRGGAREVLIELFAREDCALTAQEIDQRLASWREQGVVSRPIGIASVYRGVDVLQDLRLITRVDVGDGVARFERSSAEHGDHDHHHHHFVCDRCGMLLPFDDDALEDAINALESRLGFETKEHEVVLRGICLDCR